MKYQKKPVVVEAVQVTQQFLRELRGPLGEHLVRVDGSVEFYKDHVQIATLEGSMRGNIGDWIITGVNGEKYPCKPDIFEKTYEAYVEEEKPSFPEMLKRPELMKQVMVDAAHGGAFMQDFKMALWGAMTKDRGYIPENSLDEIAGKLYDKWIRPLRKRNGKEDNQNKEA